jgi:hypothetical protein
MIRASSILVLGFSGSGSDWLQSGFINPGDIVAAIPAADIARTNSLRFQPFLKTIVFIRLAPSTFMNFTN